MARSKIGVSTVDPIKDSGSVLLSLVKGEQLENPITLQMLSNALSGYAYEAVVVEAENVLEQTEPPKSVKVGGVQTVLGVRVPTYRGNWDGGQAYNVDEVVAYGAKYWRLVSGVARVNNSAPGVDPYWVETIANRVYLQIPQNLAATYAQQPTAETNIYGFFELRVTETSDVAFKKTWKPVRGLIEILFSPTDVVPG